MGFVYKLTPQISTFIVDQKRNQPRISCQAISRLILSTYGKEVSKSSVHELLKQSQVIIPKPRKVKEKFQIPAQKKEQISKALAPFALMSFPQETVKSHPEPIQENQDKIIPTQVNVVSLPAPVKELTKEAGQIFLKAALYDLSFKPVFEMKSFEDIDTVNYSKFRFEWAYLTREVVAIKIRNQAGEDFYLDPRFQNLCITNPDRENFSAPIERVACEAADHILNNIKPLIIRNTDVSTSFQNVCDFIATMENQPGKAFNSMVLMGNTNEVLAEFNNPLTHPRHFILGIDSKVEYFQWFMNISDNEVNWSGQENQEKGNLKLIKNDDKILITNLNQMSYGKILEIYQERHPSGESLRLNPKTSSNSFGQEVGLKDRLKERARMFFSQELTKEQLEEIFQTEGYVEESSHREDHNKTLKIQLRVDRTRDISQAIIQGIANLNKMDLRDYEGKKIAVLEFASSD